MFSDFPVQDFTLIHVNHVLLLISCNYETSLPDEVPVCWLLMGKPAGWQQHVGICNQYEHWRQPVQIC